MGLFFSRLLSIINSKKPCRILMIGLDGAGKTTVLYKLKLGELVTTIPTIGFNVEAVQYKNLEFTVWDIGGQEVIRPLWRHYYPNTNGVIYVVDSNDPARLKEARDELHSVMSEDDLRAVPLLVLANKQDLPQSVGAATVARALQLDALGHREHHVEASIATHAQGLYEGLDWLARNIQI